MVDEGALEVELVDQLGKRVDLRVGRVPERKRAVIVRDHPDGFLVFGL